MIPRICVEFPRLPYICGLVERKNRSPGVIAISLVGLTNEQREFESIVPARAIQGLVPEFSDTVSVVGTVQRVGRKVHVTYTVTANATLVCDRSLEEFTELISVHVSLDYAFDGELYNRQLGTEVEPDEIRGLREDAQEIDLTDDVRQDLVVALPMKRISPRYRSEEIGSNNEINEHHGRVEIDERWAALKKLTKE